MAAACRAKFPRSRILGISRSASSRRIALRKKWVHTASRELKDSARADIVIVCTPVNVLKYLLGKIDSSARPGTIVTDVGSIKGEIVRWAAKKKFKNIQFVGAHPMAGSHVRGIEAACEKLYQNSLIFVIRSPGTSEKSIARVKSFWRFLGGRVIEVTCEKHDLIVSRISHLPHALAVCLMLSVPPQSLDFSAQGFRDTTRIAQGHPSLWGPIFLENRRKVFESLSRFERVIKQFKKALNRKQGALLWRMLAEASKRRRNISSKNASI